MLLRIEDLVIEFVTERGVVRAVDGLSLEVEAGSTLGIVGESGCGKSVTALSILRLLSSPPARIPRGKIWFEGKNLLELPVEQMRKIRGNEIGMVFQEPMTSLNPVYSVGFQIGESLHLHHPELTTEQVMARSVELLRRVGIAEPESRIHNYPHEMSGGMRQRVVIAMALACKPKLLIADEPTTALDVTIQAQILDLLKNLQRELGMSVILITHDLGVVAETAEHVVVMYAGKPVESAPVKMLFSQPMHPYTRGLLASLPSSELEAGGERGRLKGIKGMVPDLLNLPKGCRFQDRCQLVQPRCRETEPPLEEKRKGHAFACFEVS